MKKIAKFIKGCKEHKEQTAKTKERKILEKKVEQGTDFAIREYHDVFRKLAEYDKN